MPKRETQPPLRPRDRESHGMPPFDSDPAAGPRPPHRIRQDRHVLDPGLDDRNRDRLARLGVLYPRTPGNVRHVRLGLFIRSDTELERQVSWRKQNLPSAAAFREAFERTFSPSSMTHGLPQPSCPTRRCTARLDQSLTRLRSLTDKISASLRVVVYLRRQDDHMVSRYQQV